MNIKDVGEFGFINSLKKNINRDIGDDCAILPFTEDQVLLLTTDSLVEGIHFLINKIDPYDLGFKAMAVNLSDIAAMGGTATAATVSISLPKTTPLSWLAELYRGLKDMAEIGGASIVGGDTTGSPGPFFINITILGSMARKNLKKRSHAVVGDVVCTTGFLGDSGGGLQAILHGIDHPLVSIHHKPEPHLKEGQFLASFQAVHAMMDISDGLSSDAERIAEESSVSLTIDTNNLPLSPLLIKLAKENKWDAKELALCGGEDYCLLVTIDPKGLPMIKQAFQEKFARPLYEVGRVIAQEKNLVKYSGGSFKMRRFAHFS